MNLAHIRSTVGFTLIEVILASLAASLILAALYGVFQRALAIRDSDTQRTRESRERLRAANVIRYDLRNAVITGGTFGAVIAGSTESTYQGGAAGQGSVSTSFPGYIEFTTTTGKDTSDSLYGDIQQVAYYIVSGSGSAAGGAGTSGGNLVRSVIRDLLDTQPQPQQQQILPDVSWMQVAFYDGTNWQPSWNFNTADSGTSSSTSSNPVETLPLAVRVDIQQAPATPRETPPPEVEVLVPWTTQPFTSPTPSPSPTQ
jgi:hypothetical protein